MSGQSRLVTSPWTLASREICGTLVAVGDVAGHFGARQQARRAAGGEEFAVDPAARRATSPLRTITSPSTSPAIRGVAAGDEDSVDRLAAGDGDVAGDDDDRVVAVAAAGRGARRRRGGERQRRQERR